MLTSGVCKFIVRVPEMNYEEEKKRYVSFWVLIVALVIGLLVKFETLSNQL